jgi:hypothetical protein
MLKGEAQEKSVMTKTEAVLAELHDRRGTDRCIGVAGQTGLHQQAANEIERLRSALANARDALFEVKKISPNPIKRIAGAACDRASAVLDGIS